MMIELSKEEMVDLIRGVTVDPKKLVEIRKTPYGHLVKNWVQFPSLKKCVIWEYGEMLSNDNIKDEDLYAIYKIAKENRFVSAKDEVSFEDTVDLKIDRNMFIEIICRHKPKSKVLKHAMLVETGEFTESSKWKGWDIDALKTTDTNSLIAIYRLVV